MPIIMGIDIAIAISIGTTVVRKTVTIIDQLPNLPAVTAVKIRYTATGIIRDLTVFARILLILLFLDFNPATS